MLSDVDSEDARPVARLAITEVRPGELRGAVWSEFEGLDTEAPTWHSSGRPNEGGYLDRVDELGGEHTLSSPDSLTQAWGSEHKENT